tara:strand:+ start:241 stop:651 length:411 start_codon:yes stop_codon:yes gene_type:complete
MVKPISKLKKELDTIFSLFIRLREATDEGLVQCFTCNKVSHYKSGMQNGHFQSRKHLATRWDETNCQVQCVGCNMFKAGEQYKFAINLDAKHGEGTAEELELLARTILKVSRIDYEEKITYYKGLVDNLKKDKGIQ